MFKEPKNDSPPPVTLDYRRRGDPLQPENRTKMGVQVALGAASFVISGFFAIAALATVWTNAPRNRSTSDYFLPVGFILVMYGGVASFGLYSWFRWGWRGFAAGFWAAAALLLVGFTCITGR